MNIAIVGNGHVGAALGRLWARGGHHIAFGARNPAKEELLALVASIGPQAHATTIAVAAAASEVILLGVPWAAAQDAVQAAGDLTGKIVIDCTNPLGENYHPTVQPSGAEAIASWAPGARVVKAFNTGGFNLLENPHFGEQVATTFLCGDDAEAKTVVTGLAEELGLAVIDCGPLARAHLLEHTGALWVALFRQGLGRDFAFTVLRRA